MERPYTSEGPRSQIRISANNYNNIAKQFPYLCPAAIDREPRCAEVFMRLEIHARNSNLFLAFTL